MNNVNEIYRMLNCQSKLEEQLKGIKLARNLEDLSFLILPFANGESKRLWENCAKVIASKEDDALALYLTDLFQWLQDMNWPGAEIIYRRLLHFEGPELNTAFSVCFNMAIVSRDAVWTEVLENFRKDKLL